MTQNNLIYELNGVRLPHDPDIITPAVAGALRRGNYERPEMLATPKFLNAKDRVLELGAGIGYISSYIAATIGVEHITCVDANPKLIPYIRKTHALQELKNIEVINCVAVPDSATIADGDTIEFYIRSPFWSSSLSPGRDATSVEQVPLVYLSKLIKDSAATALVVDIEGGERDIFEGVDLGTVTKIYVELHTRYIRPKGIKKCFDDLSDQGFYYDQRVSHGGVVLFRRL